MNPNSRIPLSPHWTPRRPSAVVKARLFGERDEPATLAALWATRFLPRAAACLCAIGISLAQYAPAQLLHPVGSPVVGVGELPPQTLANNRIASVSGPILEWTNALSITSTTRFLLQTFTNNSATF